MVVQIVQKVLKVQKKERKYVGYSSDVTLAFEDAQVVPPFSRDELIIQMIQMI